MPEKAQSISTSRLELQARAGKVERRHDIAMLRRFPTESILITRDSPRRNRKLNVSFSKDLLLESSVRSGDLNEAKKLLSLADSSASLDRASEGSGVTFLHQSVLNGDADMAQLLLNAGANLESRDVDGWTPLQAAAAMNADACVKILLDAGADPYAKTLDSDESALDLVEVSDKTSVQCVKHLVAAMQRISSAHQRYPASRMRDSMISMSSISTCSSFGSAYSSVSTSSAGSCPSPVFASLARCRSEDSGIDCVSSGTSSPLCASPLCAPRTPRKCPAISELSCSSLDSSDGSDQAMTPDTDSDLEADRSGSVLATWSTTSATSPMDQRRPASCSASVAQIAATSEPASASPSKHDVSSDVDMIVSTGCMAQRKRQEKLRVRVGSVCAQAAVSGRQQKPMPHRRLSFV